MMISSMRRFSAFLVLICLLFATVPTYSAEAATLLTLTTTLAQPIYSSDFLTEPSYTNASYAFMHGTAFSASGGDPCIAAQECFTIFVDLEDTGTTTTYQGQEWQSTIVPGDITWNGPANTSVSTTQRLDNDSNGRYEQLEIIVQCSAACAFAANTQYSFTIVNYPIENPEEPPVYVEGTYTSLTHLFTLTDQTVGPTETASKTAIVEIGKGITVSASVDASLTFSVTGVATSTPFYFDYSTRGTVEHPDSCNFGTIIPGLPEVCLFNLNIDTNATNGYSIYVVQDQNMTSGDGDTIKQFYNGTRLDDSGPNTWQAPTSSAYGHLGYSTNDTSVMMHFSGSAPWAGIPDIASATETAMIDGLVANSTSPGDDTYTYAIKIESATTLPAGTYSHNEYFLVVGNF